MTRHTKDPSWTSLCCDAPPVNGEFFSGMEFYHNGHLRRQGRCSDCGNQATFVTEDDEG